MLSGDVIRFQDLLGMNRYFDAEHFCHFEVKYHAYAHDLQSHLFWLGL